MEYFVNLLKIALPVMYLFTLFMYGLAFFLDEPFGIRNQTRFLAATLTIHVVYLLSRSIMTGHPPVTNVFDLMSVVALAVSAAYLYIEYVSRIKNTGMFILSIAFLFQTVSSALVSDVVDVKPVLRSWLLSLHVISAMLGYSALAISAVYGALYLMMYHEIKSSRFGLIYRKLPNLQSLEKLSYKSIIFGFVFLSLVIFVGYVWLPRAFEDFSYFDPKLIITDIVWLIYLFTLLSKRLMRLTGKTVVIVSMVGFALTIASMIVVNVFLPSFHNFK